MIFDWWWNYSEDIFTYLGRMCRLIVTRANTCDAYLLYFLYADFATGSRCSNV